MAFISSAAGVSSLSAGPSISRSQNICDSSFKGKPLGFFHQAFSGAQVQVQSAVHQAFSFTVECRKTEIHPEWFPECKVVCNGEVVFTTGSTQAEIKVDVWSGNHPFFTGNLRSVDSTGRLEKFENKYKSVKSKASARAAVKKE